MTARKRPETIAQTVERGALPAALARAITHGCDCYELSLYALKPNLAPTFREPWVVLHDAVCRFAGLGLAVDNAVPPNVDREGP